MNAPDLSRAVSADLRRDIAARKSALQPVRDAVRSHRPYPVLTRRIDLGDLGVFNAEITYDAGPGTRAVFDTDATTDWLHIHAITLNGNDVDVLPMLTASLGQETIDELADTIRAEMRAAA